MAITVNVDSYISLADAQLYLNKYHLSTNAYLVSWNALTDDDCEVLLRAAAQIIDRQPFVGFKSLTTQAMEFPRAIYTEISTSQMLLNNMFWSEDWYLQPSVPDVVKYAQCEIALQLAQGADSRVEMQRAGVKSFSLGKLSETYSNTSNDIPSYEAKQLLAPFKLGGARIC